MARGRKPDLLQAAKGYPGKRRGAVARRIEDAQRMARLLAAAPPSSDDALAPPGLLNDPLLVPALRVWEDYAPELRKTGRLGDLHRLNFAMFCVYMAEWISSTEDITRNGTWQRVETVAGGTMERQRPVVAFREIAFGNVKALSAEFGLTPREEYALFRDQAASPAGGFFGSATRPDGDGASAEAPGGDADPIGALDGFDSPPPGARPN